MAAESKKPTLSEGEARALKEAVRAHAAFLKDPKANEPVSVRQAELLRKHGKWDFGQASGTPDSGSPAGEPDPFAENAAQPAGRLELDGEQVAAEDGETPEKQDSGSGGKAARRRRQQPKTPFPLAAGDWLPRWLVYSRLAEVIGPTQWGVFAALVMLDHSSMSLEKPERGEGRRRNVEGEPLRRAFAAPIADVIAHTGLKERTIRRAIGELVAQRLLSYYMPGRGKPRGYVWPEFCMCRGTLVDLFALTAPCIPVALGGYRDLSLQRVPRQGLRIYGHENSPGEILVSTENLEVWRKRAGPEIDLRDIERVCGQ